MRHNQYRNKITRERGSVDMDHAVGGLIQKWHVKNQILNLGNWCVEEKGTVGMLIVCNVR